MEPMHTQPMGTVYAEVRERITELVAGLGDDDAERPVPTCPDWTVRQVVAHVTGVCADILAFNLAGVASDAWTDAQVTARKDRSLAEIVEEWSEIGPQAEALANQVPGRRTQQWVTDVTDHEHDIRLALGRPGARDAYSVQVGLDLMVRVGLASSLHVRRLGPVEVRTAHGQWLVGTAGPGPGLDAAAVRAEIEGVASRVLDGAEELPPTEGPPVAVLDVDGFELFRGLTGRRSRGQVERWGWSSDPTAFAAAAEFPPFRFAAAGVDE